MPRNAVASTSAIPISGAARTDSEQGQEARGIRRASRKSVAPPPSFAPQDPTSTRHGSSEKGRAKGTSKRQRSDKSNAVPRKRRKAVSNQGIETAATNSPSEHSSNEVPVDPIGTVNAGDSRDAPSDEEMIDWYDPALIPRNGQYRRRKELKRLEFANFYIDLHKVATEAIGFDRALYEWDKIIKQAENEENERKEAAVTSDDNDESDFPSQTQIKPTEFAATTSSPTEFPRRPRRNSQLQFTRHLKIPASQNEVSSATPSPLSTANNSPEPNLPPKSAQLALPSPLLLTQLARWPVHESLLPTSIPTESLEDVVLDSIARTRRQSLSRKAKHRDTTRANQRKERPKLRSAYEPNAPFFVPGVEWNQDVLVPNQDEADLSDLEDSELDENFDLPFEDLPNSITEIVTSVTTTINSLLHDLLNECEAEPIPPFNLWEKHERRKDATRREKAFGWRKIVEMVKQREDVSEAVSNELESKLSQFYENSET